MAQEMDLLPAINEAGGAISAAELAKKLKVDELLISERFELLE